MCSVAVPLDEEAPVVGVVVRDSETVEEEEEAAAAAVSARARAE